MPGDHFDSGKPRLDLLPPHAALQVAEVMTFGATKYSDDNYRKGIVMRKLVASAERHINAWLRGENTDHESYLHPLAHAAADLMMALQQLHDAPELSDGRFKKPIKESSSDDNAKDHSIVSDGICSDPWRCWTVPKDFESFVPTYGC